MSLRLPYIFCCMASVVSTPCPRQYSAQDSRCSGLVSTMTPSMSKRNARMSVKMQLRIEPGEVVWRSGDDWQGQDFGQFVGVRGSQDCREGIVALARRLDEQHPVRGIFDFSLPAVNAADSRNQIDAGGQTRFDEAV